MGDLAVHLLLFGAVALAIVLMGTLHAEADDAAAARVFPKRIFSFTLGCAVLAAIAIFA